MKIKHTFLLIFAFTQLHAQTEININLDRVGKSFESTLSSGKYIINITSTDDPSKITFLTSIVETTDPVEPIKVKYSKEGTDIAESLITYQEKYEIEIERRTRLVINVIKFDIIKKTTIQEYKFIYRGILRYKWHTTIGLAALFPFKSETYKTTETANGFRIVENGSQGILLPSIVLQFTFIDLKKTHSLGPSGGIGYDTKNLSVFGGLSYYIGQNFVITGGLAFHEQLRLDNKYDKNQSISEALSFDDLNTSYYRINPFISLTFALDNNFFKK